MAKEWAAVAQAMQARLAQLDMTQTDLVQRSRLAPMTIRELLFNQAQRRRSKQTMAAISEALDWPSRHLQDIAEGNDPGDPDASDPVLTELTQLKEAVSMINSRLDAIERQLAADDGGS